MSTDAGGPVVASAPTPAAHAAAAAEPLQGPVPPNPFRVAAAADLPNPFRAAAGAGCRRASAPAHVMHQQFGRLHPAGSGMPASGNLSVAMSLALSDAGPMMGGQPSRQPSDAAGGDGLLAKLQMRLSAVQVARSREGSQPGSPGQPSQQPQSQVQPQGQHGSGRQQAGGGQPQQPLEPVRHPSPADVAAAIAAAAEQPARDAKSRLFGMPIGALPQLSLGAPPASDAAAPGAAPQADPAAPVGREDNGSSETSGEDNKAVYLQPPPVPREGSSLRVHSGSFCMPAKTLRRLSPPALSALQPAVVRLDPRSPGRVESGRVGSSQLNFSRPTSGRVESGRLDSAQLDAAAGRPAQRDMHAPAAAAAAAVAAAAAAIAQRQRLAAGLEGPRHDTPTPDEREATAGLAQLGAKLTVGLPSGQRASHRPSWGSDTSAFHTVGPTAGHRHRLGRPSSAEDGDEAPAVAPQQHQQRQQEQSRQQEDVEMDGGSPPGQPHSSSSRSTSDELQRQAAAPAAVTGGAVVDPAAVQRRPRSVRKRSMVAESAPTPPPEPQPREVVAHGSGPAAGPFQPTAKRARNSVIDAASHARMAAYAAMVYNSNRPVGYPAIAVIPDHAAGLAEEINAVVSGSQKVVGPPGQELLASTARFRAFMGAQREAAEALRSAQGSVAFQQLRSSQSNARGGGGGSGGGGGYAGVRSDTLRSDLRSGDAVRATAAAALAENAVTASGGGAGADGRGSGIPGGGVREADGGGILGGRRSPLGRAHTGPGELPFTATGQQRPARSVRIRSQPVPNFSGGNAGGDAGRRYGGLAALAEAVAANSRGSPAPPLAAADAASPSSHQQQRQRGPDLLGSLQAAAAAANPRSGEAAATAAAAAAVLDPEDEPLPGDNIRSLSRQGPPPQHGELGGSHDGRQESGEAADEGDGGGQAMPAKRRRGGSVRSRSHPVQRHEPRLPLLPQPPATVGSAPAGSRMADAGAGSSGRGADADEAMPMIASPFEAVKRAAAAVSSPMEA